MCVPFVDQFTHYAPSSMCAAAGSVPRRSRREEQEGPSHPLPPWQAISLQQHQQQGEGGEEIPRNCQICSVCEDGFLGMKCQIVSLLNSYHACFLVVWMCRYCLNSVCDSLCVHACMCTCVCVCVFTVYVCTYCMYVSGMHLNIRTYV